MTRKARSLNVFGCAGGARHELMHGVMLFTVSPPLTTKARQVIKQLFKVNQPNPSLSVPVNWFHPFKPVAPYNITRNVSASPCITITERFFHLFDCSSFSLSRRYHSACGAFRDSLNLDRHNYKQFSFY